MKEGATNKPDAQSTKVLSFGQFRLVASERLLLKEGVPVEHEEIWPTAERRHRRPLLLSRSDERDRQRRPSRSWPSAQQSGGEFAPAISTTRTSHAALSECEDTTKVQFNSRAGPQSFQPGASSRDPRGFQTEWTCLGKVESSSEGKRSISWASRSDGSGRNLKPKPFGWLR
jgi:hypothetical protein